MNTRFLLVAILLAGLSAALVYAKISADSGGSGPSTASGDQQVVVAKTVIKQRTTITRDMLEVKNVPLNTVATGAYTDVNDLVGKVTKFPLEINQQVIASAVVDTARPTLGAAISEVVPTGRRAMSIPASQVSNVGGLILPGDWVDVLWICCDSNPIVSKTLLRNVQVAAVAQAVVSSGPVVSSTPAASASPAAGAGGDGNPVAADQLKADPGAPSVVLLLTPDEAQILFLADEAGTLRLDARNLGDTDLPPTAPTIYTQILTEQDIAALPNEMKPDGYKR
jgi:Flp pilus assembly protein CpaB